MLFLGEQACLGGRLKETSWALGRQIGGGHGREKPVGFLGEDSSLSEGHSRER